MTKTNHTLQSDAVKETSTQQTPGAKGSTDPMSRLKTIKQRRFVEEYMVDFNGAQAAIRAGYSPQTARVIASQNLSKLNIQEAIQAEIEKLSERTMTEAEQVVGQLERIAFFDPLDYIRHMPIDGPWDFVKLPGHVRRVIRGWHWDARGNFIPRFMDCQQALFDLGKHLGLFHNRHVG